MNIYELTILMPLCYNVLLIKGYILLDKKKTKLISWNCKVVVVNL